MKVQPRCDMRLMKESVSANRWNEDQISATPATKESGNSAVAGRQVTKNVVGVAPKSIKKSFSSRGFSGN